MTRRAWACTHIASPDVSSPTHAPSHSRGGNRRGCACQTSSPQHERHCGPPPGSWNWQPGMVWIVPARVRAAAARRRPRGGCGSFGWERCGACVAHPTWAPSTPWCSSRPRSSRETAGLPWSPAGGVRLPTRIPPGDGSSRVRKRRAPESPSVRGSLAFQVESDEGRRGAVRPADPPAAGHDSTLAQRRIGAGSAAGAWFRAPGGAASTRVPAGGGEALAAAPRRDSIASMRRSYVRTKGA